MLGPVWTPKSRSVQFYACKQKQLNSISENYSKIFTFQVGTHKWILKQNVRAGVIIFDHVQGDELREKIILHRESVD